MTTKPPGPSASPPIRLLVFTEHRNATWYINYELPLTMLVASGEVELASWSSDELDRLSWDEVDAKLAGTFSGRLPDAIILSRFVRPYGIKLIERARALGVASFFHLDDFLFALPDDIGEQYRERYGGEYPEDLKRCLEEADTVLVSTEALAAALEPMLPGKAMEVLVGVCYLPTLAGRSKLRSVAGRMRHRLRNRGYSVIGYMGSNSHVRDLAIITEDIAVLLKKNPKLRFETLGLPLPEGLRHFGPERVRAYGYTRGYAEFLQSLFELGWDIGLAPVVDDAFNRCKTATKFVEYTACSVPTLASDSEPYGALAKTHGAVGLGHLGAWTGALENWLSDLKRPQQILKKAETLCARHWSTHRAAERLLEIVLLHRLK